MFNVEDRLDEVWIEIEKNPEVKEASDNFSELSKQLEKVLPELNQEQLSEMDDCFNNTFLIAVEVAYKAGVKDVCSKLNEDPKQNLLKQLATSIN